MNSWPGTIGTLFQHLLAPMRGKPKPAPVDIIVSDEPDVANWEAILEKPRRSVW